MFVLLFIPITVTEHIVTQKTSVYIIILIIFFILSTPLFLILILSIENKKFF